MRGGAQVGLGVALALVLGVAKPEAGGQAPAASAATGPTVTVAGARLDWAKGHLVATGAAAAALRAPGPDVARVGAERAARTRALATLSRAVLAVPVASGGTVQDLVGQDPAKARRLTAAVERARTIDTSYASDGSAQVVVALPLEGVRLALWPAPTPAGGCSPPRRKAPPAVASSSTSPRRRWNKRPGPARW